MTHHRKPESPKRKTAPESANIASVGAANAPAGAPESAVAEASAPANAKAPAAHDVAKTIAPTSNTNTATACVICARIAFAIVFAINVQCAVSFVLWPSHFASAYELSGVAGNVAVQGIGVAFLMWNATYPAFIASPRKFFPLGAIIISQQVIGLAGESFILATLPAQHAMLASSITRFIIFDASGLIIMAASFIWLLAERKQEMRQAAHARPTCVQTSLKQTAHAHPTCEQASPKQARARTAVPRKQADSPLANSKPTTNSQNGQEKDSL